VHQKVDTGTETLGGRIWDRKGRDSTLQQGEHTDTPGWKAKYKWPLVKESNPYNRDGVGEGNNKGSAEKHIP